MIATIAAIALATASATPAKVTPTRVGGVKLGMLHAAAQDKGLVGRARVGCELEGPGTRAAVLRAPLKGAVELSRKSPRRIKSIVVTKNATARGVAIGDGRAKVKAAFPKAKFDESVQETFGITLVRIPKDGGGRMQMALDADTDRVTEFGVPYIRFCE